MDSAFMPETNQTTAYSPVDPGIAAAAEMPMEHHHHHQHHLHHGQQQHLSRFSTGSDSRTQTPSLKRLRDGDDSDGGEFEATPRNSNMNGNGEGTSGATGDDSPNDKRAGRRKIKIEFIEDKSRRHITFSKRKAGIMKKAYELSTLTGTQVLLLVVSETGLVYTFTTPKLQPIVTQNDGKNLIQACLSVPDQPGDRILMPIPTESNTYMSQPRHSGNHTPNAATAGSGVTLTNPHDLNQRFADEQKPDLSSPAATTYMQYSYAHNTLSQAAIAAAVNPAAGNNGGIQQYHAAAA
ncbi:transcription factor of the MADS box, partial [Coemansia aciculifera]